MAWDTLQRWQEGNHIDTSAYRITPYRRTPIPRISPWVYFNEALKTVLPTLDPVERAKRQMMLAELAQQPQKLALQKQQMDAQSQLIGPTLAAKKAQLEAQAAGAGTSTGRGYFDPTGKWHPNTTNQQNTDQWNQLFNSFLGIRTHQQSTIQNPSGNTAPTPDGKMPPQPPTTQAEPATPETPAIVNPDDDTAPGETLGPQRSGYRVDPNLAYTDIPDLSGAS